MTFRVNMVWMLVAALFIAAPVRAADTSPETSTPLLTPAFLKASAGAAAGAWAGAKLLGWAPMLSGMSQIAKASPFAALVARPLVPVLAGAIGAQIAGKGIAHIDWAMVAAQTACGAVGTAAALLIAPGAGLVGPWIGELAGWYGGTWLLTKWRKHVAARDARPAAPSTIAVPAIRGASNDAAQAYERWRLAKEAGAEVAARQAYTGVVSALNR